MEGQHERKINLFLFGVGCLLVAVLCIVPNLYRGFADSSAEWIPNCVSDSCVERIVQKIPMTKNGDLICRMGNGFFSNFFSKLSGGQHRFSHIGMIHKQEDQCFVIHADANELTGEGSVKIQPINDFLKEGIDFELFRVGDGQWATLADSLAVDYLLKKTPFDCSFDISSDSTLYCTELVACCFNRAVQDSSWITPCGNINGKLYYQISDILTKTEIIK